MKTIKKEKAKSFDAVQMMRESRDKISQETENMTFEELRLHIKAKLAASNTRLIGQQ